PSPACVVSLYCPGPPRLLPSSPTRRSSDLGPAEAGVGAGFLIATAGVGRGFVCGAVVRQRVVVLPAQARRLAESVECGRLAVPRSEEHTSELQSLTNLVCRLLLEKKNTHQR